LIYVDFFFFSNFYYFILFYFFILFFLIYLFYFIFEVETREDKRNVLKKNIAHQMMIVDDLLTKIQQDKQQYNFQVKKKETNINKYKHE